MLFEDADECVFVDLLFPLSGKDDSHDGRPTHTTYVVDDLSARRPTRWMLDDLCAAPPTCWMTYVLDDLLTGQPMRCTTYVLDNLLIG